MKYFKVCRVKCKRCGDVLEYINKTKQDNGNDAMWCSCGKVMLDPSASFYRIGGYPDDYEDLSEEWEEDIETVIQQVGGSMAIEGMKLSAEDKERIRQIMLEPEKTEAVIRELVKKHSVTEPSEQWEYKHIYIALHPAPGDDPADGLRKQLNNFGVDGWELVSISDGLLNLEYVDGYAVFKRRK